VQLQRTAAWQSNPADGPMQVSPGDLPFSIVSSRRTVDHYGLRRPLDLLHRAGDPADEGRIKWAYAPG
jgi:hypothetical protein